MAGTIWLLMLLCDGAPRAQRIDLLSPSRPAFRCSQRTTILTVLRDVPLPMLRGARSHHGVLPSDDWPVLHWRWQRHHGPVDVRGRSDRPRPQRHDGLILLQQFDISAGLRLLLGLSSSLRNRKHVQLRLQRPLPLQVLPTIPTVTAASACGPPRSTLNASRHNCDSWGLRSVADGHVRRHDHRLDRM